MSWRGLRLPNVASRPEVRLGCRDSPTSTSSAAPPHKTPDAHRGDQAGPDAKGCSRVKGHRPHPCGCQEQQGRACATQHSSHGRGRKEPNRGPSTRSHLFALQSQQRHEPLLVKPDDDLTIDHRHGRGRDSQRHQLIHGGGILRHIPGLKRDPVLGEELLHPFAEDSAGLVEDDHGLCHGIPPGATSQPGSTFGCRRRCARRCPAPSILPGATSSRLAGRRRDKMRSARCCEPQRIRIVAGRPDGC